MDGVEENKIIIILKVPYADKRLLFFGKYLFKPKKIFDLDCLIIDEISIGLANTEWAKNWKHRK